MMYSKKRTHQQMKDGYSHRDSSGFRQKQLHRRPQVPGHPSVPSHAIILSGPSEKLVADFLEAIRTPGTTFSSLQLFSEALQKDAKNLVGVLCQRTSGTEVTSLLAMAMKLKAADIALIFGILEKIILTIVSELDALESFALEMVEQLLAKHVKTFYYMLKTTNKSNQIKSALKLLISLCALGNRSVRLLIANFSFSAANFSAVILRRNTVDPQDVRAMGIHLLVAILMFGDNVSVRSLAQMKNVITAAFPGLIVDRPEIIKLFLSTLLDKIVKNVSVSKTVKIQLFNQTTLRQLLKVFAWNGHKKSEKEFSENEVLSDAAMEDQTSVREAILQFLLAVCSSVKFGIVFQDPLIGTGSKNANHILTEVMRTLLPTSGYHRSLMRAVIQAAPDQIIHVLPNWKPGFVPRLSDNWFQMMTWLNETYDEVDLVSKLKSISSKSVIQPALVLVLPPWMDKEFQSEAFATALPSDVAATYAKFLVKAVLRAHKIAYILSMKDRVEFLKQLPDRFVDPQMITAYSSAHLGELVSDLLLFLEIYAIVCKVPLQDHSAMENANSGLRTSLKREAEDLLQNAEKDISLVISNDSTAADNENLERQRHGTVVRPAAAALREELTVFLFEFSSSNPQTLCGPLLDLLLSAYGATLSLADQNIYRALLLADANGNVVNKDSFVLFGKLAQRQQQLRFSQGVAIPHVASLREFIDSLDQNMLLQTALHFPIQLPLEATTSWVLVDTRIYDPRFLLANLGILLSKPKINIVHFIESGCLSVVVAALGSLDPAMRKAAGFVLSSLEAHAAQNGFKGKEQLLYVLTQIRRASKSAKAWPRLWTVLLARFFSVFFESQNHSYQITMEFFLVKPDFNLETVPEFLKLFESGELTHLKDRKFILDIIKTGVRHYRDFEICCHSHVFEALLSMYDSPLSTKAQNQHISEILQAVSGVSYVGRALIKQLGLFTWLSHVFSNGVEDECLLSLLQCAVNCMGDALLAKPANRGFLRSNGFLLIHPLLKIGDEYVKNVSIIEAILKFIHRLVLLCIEGLEVSVTSSFSLVTVLDVAKLAVNYIQLTPQLHCGAKVRHQRLVPVSSCVRGLQRAAGDFSSVLLSDFLLLLTCALDVPDIRDLDVD